MAIPLTIDCSNRILENSQQNHLRLTDEGGFPFESNGIFYDSNAPHVHLQLEVRARIC